MENLPWPVITAAGGGWTLLGIMVWAIISGRLVPRATMEDVIHDRNEWRAESRIKDAQISEKDHQLQQLAEVGETQKAVLSAISRLAGQERA